METTSYRLRKEWMGASTKEIIQMSYLTIKNVYKIQGESFVIVKQECAGIIREVRIEQTHYLFLITTMGTYDYNLEFRLERKMLGNGTYMVEVNNANGKLMSSVIGKNQLGMRSFLKKIEEMVTTWCTSNAPF